MGKVVCVTGASGYIASWLVKLLLLRGYTVKATVRNLSDPQKVAHLMALEGADERLHLYEANLLEEGSFDSAVDGCEAMVYSLKTLAEKATWEFVEENGLDLVTLHPGFVIGPPLQPTLNLTSEAFLNLINGKELFSDGVYRYVDVRDVALAHILAFENPSASGRYCLVGRVTHSSEVRAILTESFPSLNLHAKSTENLPARPAYQVSKEKAKILGINFTRLEVSLKDTVECLKEKNLLSF
ncbi:Cinnamoyl-CoA reductase 1 [Sesamum angolense]|uniref:Cinnamoyl-CoA reductase 1 n=1 Tax=Sesamum angolense TaxID=2727404 RepID=A0AAE1XGR6_9LAMI|nr:Cinnamoyl-CoA reductase 1 [Sesamum angolense]